MIKHSRSITAGYIVRAYKSNALGTQHDCVHTLSGYSGRVIRPEQLRELAIRAAMLADNRLLTPDDILLMMKTIDTGLLSGWQQTVMQKPNRSRFAYYGRDDAHIRLMDSLSEIAYRKASELGYSKYAFPAGAWLAGWRMRGDSDLSPTIAAANAITYARGFVDYMNLKAKE
jgi:hypothetical protein|nr:MAG TPA: hypothetical protein [Caudoviricetes sp.]